MKTSSILACTALIIFFISSCKKEAGIATARVPELPDEVYKYDEFQTLGFGFSPVGTHTIDNNLATLGRVLFYETQLSINNRVSCGSCHLQSKAFADKSAMSIGFENASTSRNTPAIINAGTQSSYFWDMRETNLSAMVTQPIANHIEMGLDQPDYIVAKVQKLPYYESLFTAAFGSSEVTIDKIGSALSNFVAAMVTTSSKFDKAATGADSFTPEEAMGKQLFETLPCASCHGGENFSGWGSFTQNIGLELDYTDNGMPGTDWNTGREMDGWFKVPSLRNVALTAPYMHDGRFATLEEVIDFYDHGIQPHDQLAFNLREGWNGGIDFFPVEPVIDTQPNPTNGVQPLRLNLEDHEKRALIAFLKTLTDESLVADVKFADPFVAAH